MGHSVGISDSYYRATEHELLEDYFKAVPVLTISNENRLQTQMDNVVEESRKIAERYMGKKNGKAYGRRNSGEGAVLVKINPTKIIAEKDIASWD
jgi:hypothetical protein